MALTYIMSSAYHHLCDTDHSQISMGVVDGLVPNRHQAICNHHDDLWLWTHSRAANQYGISVFCTEFTCKIREYEFGLQNTEIELCQFCHIKYCCQNKAYLFWVANQSRFVAFYALKPSNTSLITKTFNLLSSTCSSNTFSCPTSCSCSTERIH